jgi:hypothetical protein
LTNKTINRATALLLLHVHSIFPKRKMSTVNVMDIWLCIKNHCAKKVSATPKKKKKLADKGLTRFYSQGQNTQRKV